MEFIQGQQLHTRTVFHAAEHQRRNLYIGLIDTLAQLRKLEFSAAGSLMPNPDNLDDESNPVLGPFLSMTVNELERKLERPVLTEIFTSVNRFMDLHYHILSQTFQLPVEELDRRQAKMELFALESVSKEIPKKHQIARTWAPIYISPPGFKMWQYHGWRWLPYSWRHWLGVYEYNSPADLHSTTMDHRPWPWYPSYGDWCAARANLARISQSPGGFAQDIKRLDTVVSRLGIVAPRRDTK